MKKYLLLFIVLLFSLFACSAQSDVLDNESGTPDQENQVALAAPTRKIIYKADATIYSSNIDPIKTDIINRLEVSEWVDEISTTSDYIYLKLRIKTTRLDDFMTSLDTAYQLNRYSKTSEDVSLNYFDKQGKIDTLGRELVRLNLLYDSASITDMITINERVSQIETELQKLNKEVNELDSMIDYSEVTLRLYQDKKAPSTSFFGKN